MSMTTQMETPVRNETAEVSDQEPVQQPVAEPQPVAKFAAPTPPAAAKAASREVPTGEDYSYRPISLLAPLTLFFAFCSLFGVLGLLGVMMAGVGVCVGGLCLWSIRKSDGELGGYAMALTGTLVCLVMGTVGGSYQGYVYATEVPEGYERLDFNWLAKQNPIFVNGRYILSEDLKEVDGRKIYVKGYMYPMEQRVGLKEFVLCKDTGECCFGGEPKITDMIHVNFVDGVTADHRELILSGVAGTLRVKPKVSDGKLVGLFTLEATHFR